MSREARTKPEDAGNVVGGKFAVVAFGEGGKVRYASIQSGSGGAAAFSVCAVASGAKLFVHRFTRGDVGGRQLRFLRIVRRR